LDSIDENNNPFLNQSNQYEEAEEYLDNMSNEWYIYGSSGHGRFARAFPVGNDGGYDNLFYPSPTIQSRYLKHKQYELKDHLGNVRVVVSDFKYSTTSGDSVSPYRAEVLAAYNYYPFGMLQPGMYAENNDQRYRFGFNGMLRDDDVTDKLSTGSTDEGRGNSYDFGARMYNPRVTRFFSLDPMKNKMPWQTPYAFASNTPIIAIDKNGESTFYIHGTGQSSRSNLSTNLRGTVDYLHSNLSTSTGKVDYGFDWSRYSHLTNTVDHRKVAARDLANYVIRNNKPGDDITLIGYSHGGNVALQAAQIIALELNTKVNLITIATPAYNIQKKYQAFENSTSAQAKLLFDVNKTLTSENPEYNPGINDMIHFWLDDDGVAGGLAGDDIFNSGKVRNIHVNDGNKDWDSPAWRESHGFIYFPSMIKTTVESQNVQPLEPINE
jgi:RHS repeat-associated protein